MTNIQTIVKMGMSISNFHYDEESQRLYVSGPALEEGVWTGLDGIPTFYPRSVIHEGSHLFEGCDIVCEHLGLPIGKVTSVCNTEMGFDVVQGYITNAASVDAVLSGQKNGFSIEAAIIIDPVRRVAERIVEAMNISLVSQPACRVCNINNAQLNEPRPYTEGNIAMSENKEVNASELDPELEVTPVTEPTTVSTVQMGSGPCDEPTEEDTKVGAFKELTTAAEAFKSAKAKLDKVLLGFGEVIEQVDPEVTPEVVEQSVSEEPVPEGSPEPVSEVVEQETEVEPEGTIVPESEDTPVSESEDTPVSNVTTDDITEVKTALSAAATKIGAVTDKLVELTNTVQIMEVALGQAKTEASTYKEKAEMLEAELVKIENNERDTIVAEIKELDPEVDSEFISGMTIAQLSAYKTNVQRIVAKMPLADKKSVKRDETVELSAPKSESTIDLTDTASRKKFIEQSLQK